MSSENQPAPGAPLPPKNDWKSRVVIRSTSGKPRWIQKIVGVILVLVIGYGLYEWEVCRVVVDPGHVLVLLKKNGSKSLPGDNIIIPRPPDPNDPDYAAKFKAWNDTYGDCNGIMEQVYAEGTYFAFSPFDYEREVLTADQVSATAIVPNGKVGIVVRKFGDPLPAGQVLADTTAFERGPLPIVLEPGRYNEYANPYAYEIKQVDPIQINPGFRGVVTIMAGRPAA